MDHPRYNIRAVERLTGVPAPTLRSWERRYGFPAPQRTVTGRRLYSDRDVQSILRVKHQLEAGLSAANAVRWVKESGGAAPAATPAPDVRAPRPKGEADARLRDALLAAVAHYDEMMAEAALSAAFARHTPDTVLIELIGPVLVEIGDRWAHGELPVTAEHFATHVIRRRLLTLLSQQPPLPENIATVVLACVPGEQHELGLLMLALFLRWGGLRVLYLGADVPLNDLVRCVRETRPTAVCLSAIDLGSVHALVEAATRVRREIPGVPLYAGGAAAGSAALPAGVERPSRDLPIAANQILGVARER